ncbi:MAG TPA: hypothetical protein VK468_04240 [Pyrinomonadaceae bacterium]|nr:hypothetical protein [Pyrinomonadaceae bacterium]
MAVSLQPNILVSDWIGKLKGSSSHYINHEVQPKLWSGSAVTASLLLTAWIFAAKRGRTAKAAW